MFIFSFVRHTFAVRFSLILAVFLLLAACSLAVIHPNKANKTSETATSFAGKGALSNLALNTQPSFQFRQSYLSKVRKQTLLWDRIRESYQIDHKSKDPKIQYYVKKFSNSNYLNNVTQSSAPYLYMVVEALERRNLPGELALLPIVESDYNPTARSEKGAAGLWQMMPFTAKRFGLKRDHWYDGRMDVRASTEAALDYLDYLKEIFKDDWLLAIAAYNSGEGKVMRSMKRNRSNSKATNFWALGLPKQTKDYVPKLLALAEIISDPESYGVQLPVIYNEPYLAGIHLDSPLHFNEAAKLAGMTLKELKKLNGGYHKLTYHPTSSSPLLMPVDKVSDFLEKARHLPAVRIASMNSVKEKKVSLEAVSFASKLKSLFFAE